MSELDKLSALYARGTQGKLKSFPPNSRGMTGIRGPDCLIYSMTFDSECLKETHDRQRRDAEFFAISHNLWPQIEAVLRATSEMNRLLNDWDLIRQHSYAHERLNSAMTALDAAIKEQIRE